jgi:hypothetical protein
MPSGKPPAAPATEGPPKTHDKAARARFGFEQRPAVGLIDFCSHARGFNPPPGFLRRRFTSRLPVAAVVFPSSRARPAKCGIRIRENVVRVQSMNE